MPIFNDLYYSTPGSSYVKKPIQDFVNAGQALNQTWETNKQKHDILELAKANAKARNSVLGKQQADLYDEAFNEFKPYIENNDYENANGVADKVARKLGSNPILKAIQEDNAAWQEFVSTNQKRLASGEINADDLRDRIYINDKLHQGKIQYDPVTGEVKNQFKGDLIPKKVNYREMFDKIYADLKASNLPPDKAAQIQGYIANATAKGISADNLEAIAQNAIMADPDALGYLKFQVGNEITKNRLQDDGTLRDYNVSDLMKAGVLNPDGSIKIKDNPKTTDIDEAAELQGQLFNPDGSINQETANNIYTNSVVNNKLDAVKNYAGSKAWKEQDVKYLSDVDYAFYIKKKELDYEDKLTRKREEDAQTNLYLEPYNIDINSSAKIDPKNSELFVGKENDMSFAEMPLSNDLKTSLGQENPVIYQNVKVIQELQKELDKARLKAKTTIASRDNKTIKKGETLKDHMLVDEEATKRYTKEGLSEIGRIKLKMAEAWLEIKKTNPSLALQYDKNASVDGTSATEKYNAISKFANEYKPKANLNEPQIKELDRAERIRKALNGVKPVKLASLDGKTNVHKNENGTTFFDVEFDVGGSLEAWRKDNKLEPDDIEYLKKNNLLVNDNVEQVDDDGKVKKPATWKYRTQMKVTPTPESNVMFNNELKLKETLPHIASSMKKTTAKDTYQVIASKNPDILNQSSQIEDHNKKVLTVGELIKKLPTMSDTDFETMSNYLDQILK
jgi:hypothetical protein